MKKTKLVVLGLTSILAIAGCTVKKQPVESESESDSQSESIDRSVKSVTLNKHEITLEEEGAESLVATILPENALNKKLNWSSSDEDIAMVSGLGKVRALSAGTATITVSSDEDETIKDTCIVRVNAKDRTVHVESVSLNRESLTIEKGDIEVLTATVLPNNATDKSVTWNSDNTSVATVANGVVTAVSKGKANITVTSTDGAKTATCDVGGGETPLVLPLLNEGGEFFGEAVDVLLRAFEDDVEAAGRDFQFGEMLAEGVEVAVGWTVEFYGINGFERQGFLHRRKRVCSNRQCGWSA